MSKSDFELNPFTVALDYTRGAGQLEFLKRYKKLDSNTLAKIPYSMGDLQNAFQHAYTAAKFAYGSTEELVRYVGYLRELGTEDEEKRANGQTNAYLDTNRDLWNNDVGIKYAIQGRKQGKTTDEIGDIIFNEIIKKDSDFIVEFKNDKRRWDPSSSENTLWNNIGKQLIPQPIQQGVETIKEKGRNLLKGAIRNTQSNSYKYVNFDGIGYNSKKWKDWSPKEQKAFTEGFIGKSLNNENWTNKFNIGNPDTDKGHWVTLDNGKHLFIKDK